MRSRIFLTVLCSLCLCAAARGEDLKEARELLGKAIAALGGEKALAAEGSLSGKSKGTIDANNTKLTISNDWVVQGTDRFEWTTEFTANDGKPNKLTVGLGGGKVWVKGGGNQDKANELPKEYQTAFVQTFAALRLVENPTLLGTKGATLSHLGEVEIGKKAAVGIKVTRKGQPDLDVYFDKKTRLPVKASLRVKDAGSGSEDVEYAGYFGGYKKFGDRLHFTAMKVERDGKVVIDVERSDIAAGEKRDDSEFAKP